MRTKVSVLVIAVLLFVPAAADADLYDYRMPTASCGSDDYVWGYEWWNLIGQLSAGVKTHLVIDHCYSGGIVRDTETLPNHAGFSASQPNELSWGDPYGDWMKPFVDDLDSAQSYNHAFGVANPSGSTPMRLPSSGSSDTAKYNPSAGKVWKSIVWVDGDNQFKGDAENCMDMLVSEGWSENNISLLFGTSGSGTLTSRETSKSYTIDGKQSQADLKSAFADAMNTQNLERLDIYVACHGDATDRVLTNVTNEGKTFDYYVTQGYHYETGKTPVYGGKKFKVYLGDDDLTHWEGVNTTIQGDTWIYSEGTDAGGAYALWTNSGTHYDYDWKSEPYKLKFTVNYTLDDPFPVLVDWRTWCSRDPDPFDGSNLWARKYEYLNNIGLGGGPSDWLSDAYLHALGVGDAVPMDGSLDFHTAAVTWGKGTGYDWYFGTVSAYIPEPSSLVVWCLIGLSLAGAGWSRRKHKAR